MAGSKTYKPEEVLWVLAQVYQHHIANNLIIQRGFKCKFNKVITDNQLRYIKNKYRNDPEYNCPASTENARLYLDKSKTRPAIIIDSVTKEFPHLLRESEARAGPSRERIETDDDNAEQEWHGGSGPVAGTMNHTTSRSAQLADHAGRSSRYQEVSQSQRDYHHPGPARQAEARPPRAVRRVQFQNAQRQMQDPARQHQWQTGAGPQPQQQPQGLSQQQTERYVGRLNKAQRLVVELGKVHGLILVRPPTRAQANPREPEPALSTPEQMQQMQWTLKQMLEQLQQTQQPMAQSQSTMHERPRVSTTSQNPASLPAQATGSHEGQLGDQHMHQAPENSHPSTSLYTRQPLQSNLNADQRLSVVESPQQMPGTQAHGQGRMTQALADVQVSSSGSGHHAAQQATRNNSVSTQQSPGGTFEPGVSEMDTAPDTDAAQQDSTVTHHQFEHNPAQYPSSFLLPGQQQQSRRRSSEEEEQGVAESAQEQVDHERPTEQQLISEQQANGQFNDGQFAFDQFGSNHFTEMQWTDRTLSNDELAVFLEPPIQDNHGGAAGPGAAVSNGTRASTAAGPPQQPGAAASQLSQGGHGGAHGNEQTYSYLTDLPWGSP